MVQFIEDVQFDLHSFECIVYKSVVIITWSPPHRRQTPPTPPPPLKRRSSRDRILMRWLHVIALRLLAVEQIREHALHQSHQRLAGAKQREEYRQAAHHLHGQNHLVRRQNPERKLGEAEHQGYHAGGERQNADDVVEEFGVHRLHPAEQFARPQRGRAVQHAQNGEHGGRQANAGVRRDQVQLPIEGIIDHAGQRHAGAEGLQDPVQVRLSFARVQRRPGIVLVQGHDRLAHQQLILWGVGEETVINIHLFGHLITMIIRKNGNRL